MTQSCSWCGREFEPLLDLPSWGYDLLLVNKLICLQCADAFEQSKVLLHCSHVKGFLDEVSHVTTASGTILPLEIIQWTHIGLKWLAKVVDIYGHHWLLKIKKPNLVELKPVGR